MKSLLSRPSNLHLLSFPTLPFLPPRVLDFRLRARFNALYQAKRIAQYAVESEPTPDDFNKYVAQFPEEGDKLNRMYTAGDISGALLR